MRPSLPSVLAAGLVALGGIAAEAQQRPTPRGGQSPASPSSSQSSPSVSSAQAGGMRAMRTSAVTLRGLDKIAGTTTELRLGAGEVGRLGRLEIRLGECRRPADDPDSDAFAQLTITDLSAGKLVFSGWMIASSPALSALDDARYDVWVVACQSDSASGSGPVNAAGTDSAADSLR